jgi:hypothetical protein
MFVDTGHELDFYALHNVEGRRDNVGVLCVYCGVATENRKQEKNERQPVVFPMKLPNAYNAL